VSRSAEACVFGGGNVTAKNNLLVRAIAMLFTLKNLGHLNRNKIRDTTRQPHFSAFGILSGHQVELKFKGKM
jgi:hypothetical protein